MNGDSHPPVPAIIVLRRIRLPEGVLSVSIWPEFGSELIDVVWAFRVGKRELEKSILCLGAQHDEFRNLCDM